MINSMAEDIMEKKDGASVRARVWKAGGMRERERERDQNEITTMISRRELF